MVSYQTLWFLLIGVFVFTAVASLTMNPDDPTAAEAAFTDFWEAIIGILAVLIAMGYLIGLLLVFDIIGGFVDLVVKVVIQLPEWLGGGDWVIYLPVELSLERIGDRILLILQGLLVILGALGIGVFDLVFALIIWPFELLGINLNFSLTLDAGELLDDIPLIGEALQDIWEVPFGKDPQTISLPFKDLLHDMLQAADQTVEDMVGSPESYWREATGEDPFW